MSRQTVLNIKIKPNIHLLPSSNLCLLGASGGSCQKIQDIVHPQDVDQQPATQQGSVLSGMKSCWLLKQVWCFTLLSSVCLRDLSSWIHHIQCCHSVEVKSLKPASFQIIFCVVFFPSAFFFRLIPSTGLNITYRQPSLTAIYDFCQLQARPPCPVVNFAN